MCRSGVHSAVAADSGPSPLRWRVYQDGTLVDWERERSGEMLRG